MDRDLGSVPVFIAKYRLHQASPVLPPKISQIKPFQNLRSEKSARFLGLSIVTEMVLQLIAISRLKGIE